MKNDDGSHIRIRFRCERLSDFCYACGIIGHLENKCPRINKEGFVSKKLGSWLKASSDFLMMKESSYVSMDECFALQIREDRGKGYRGGR